MATQLLDSSGAAVVVQAGESSNVVATFTFAGTAIVKANIVSIVATLYLRATGAVINARNAVNVKDANDGALATDGTLTWRLGLLDNVIVGSVAVGKTEVHVVRLLWTWSDGVATRTGIQEFWFPVEPLTVAA